MFEIPGKYNKAKVYAATVDGASYAQVLRMCNTEKLKNSRIAMMPDMHAAEGCTVGTSLTIGEYVNPAFVGGDIGWCASEGCRFCAAGGKDFDSHQYARRQFALRGKRKRGMELYRAARLREDHETL